MRAGPKHQLPEHRLLARVGTGVTRSTMSVPDTTRSDRAAGSCSRPRCTSLARSSSSATMPTRRLASSSTDALLPRFSISAVILDDLLARADAPLRPCDQPPRATHPLPAAREMRPHGGAAMAGKRWTVTARARPCIRHGPRGSSLRQPGGPGWIDPVRGRRSSPRRQLLLGLKDVCTEAEVLAPAIDDGLAGRRPTRRVPHPVRRVARRPGAPARRNDFGAQGA